jgi:hypothetical protein
MAHGTTQLRFGQGLRHPIAHLVRGIWISLQPAQLDALLLFPLLSRQVPRVAPQECGFGLGASLQDMCRPVVLLYTSGVCEPPKTEVRAPCRGATPLETLHVIMEDPWC